MLFFFLILLPVSLVFYEFENKRSRDFIPIIIGFLSAVLVCAFNIFFMFAHRIIPYSFMQNFCFYFIKQYILPICILFGVFFFVARDSYEERIKAFFPLMVSYYSVYMPYSVITTYTSNSYSGYDIFIKPLIVLSLLVECTICINRIYYAVKNKNIFVCVIFSIILITYVIFPAVFEALYLLKSVSNILLNILIFIYISQVIVYFVVKLLKKNL